MRYTLITALIMLAACSPDCKITSWYNIKFDQENSFNEKQLKKTDTCSKHPKNTPHFYVEVRNP